MMKRPGEFWRVWHAIFCMVLITTWLVSPAFAATGITGKVTFNGLPVPGATVTATQGDNKVVVVTDEQGAYTFGELGDGAWTFKVEMPGFATQTQDVTVAQGTAGPSWELKILSLADMTHGVAPVQAENTLPQAPTPSTTPAATAPANAANTTPAAGGGQPNGGQRPAANAANNTPAPAPAQAADTSANSGSSGDLQQSAASSLVVNGSVNNGAASPFAQMAAFGNNRRGPGLFYNGNFGASFDTSAWDARSFTLNTGSGGAKPSYNQLQFLGSFGGPIGIPRHYLNQSNFTLSYQHGANDNAVEATGLVPTAAEQQGNFTNVAQIYEPGTNIPYPNDTLPTINAQAQKLLNQYPQSNILGALPGTLNYERSAISTTHSDALQSRFFKNVKNRNSINGSFGFQRQVGQNNGNIFNYTDGTNVTGLDGTLSWSRTYRPGGIGYFNTQFQYEYNRQVSSNSPFFANRTNLSGAAGIEGNDQDPQFWGPPSLAFGSSGTQGLSDVVYSHSVNDTQTVTYKSLWYRGKHSFQFGGDMLRLQFNSFSQQNPRGTFTFNGNETEEVNTDGTVVKGTGYDLADFLLGVPDNATIAFGNTDKYLRGWRYDAYLTDDWRVKAGFTADIGVRWEFATPLTEIHNRLANLDVTPGFTDAATIAATDPIGAKTARKYPSSLLNSDYRGIEPRIAIAWRPRSNSPLVVRAGYGVYDMTSVYQVIATQMAQQPPFSKTFNLANTTATPLTLQTAFNTLPAGVSNTFGVDPNFRIGYAQQWNASVQQDLPGSLVMTVTYNGIKGTRLMQEYMPNTYAGNTPYDGHPVGFVYLSSGGNSTRESGTAQLRRRLRDGLTATLQYTYSKSLDDASAFSGASIVSGGAGISSIQGGSSGATSIAQDWTHLERERGPSTFDQRNVMTFSTQYTTGEGLRAGALMSGWRGTLFKDWTFVTNLTMGSGLPLTPIYGPAASGGQVEVRPDTTGASVYAAPPGKHLNPAAFQAPQGEWGDAGRDSIVGPSQFGLNASFSRTFRLNSRMDATWETDVTNVLNMVTASSWYTNMQNTSLFGTDSAWNQMRKLQTTIRMRF